MTLVGNNKGMTMEKEQINHNALILAIVNLKGGVGKTTTAVNLSAAIAATNQRVLLVDLDTQAAASTSLGFRDSHPSSTISDVLSKGLQIQESIMRTKTANLHLLKGGDSSAQSYVSASDMPRLDTLVNSALRPIRNLYDFFIIDCPPSLSLMSMNAMVAADAVIVPVVPHSMALGGLTKLKEVISDNAKIRQQFGVESDLLGILLTQVDYRIKPTPAIIDKIRTLYIDWVFETVIEMNPQLAEAPSFGKTIFEYDPASSGAEAFSQLAIEIMKRCRSLNSYNQAKHEEKY